MCANHCQACFVAPRRTRLRRVRIVLEAVPNVSEGQRVCVISAIGAAFGRDALLLDTHSDADHNRSVFTLAAEEHDLLESLLAGIAAAVERIDLREHVGVHPRVGAVDVVPVVPFAPESMERANRGPPPCPSRRSCAPVFLSGEVGGAPRMLRRRSRRLGDASTRQARPGRGPSRDDPGLGRAVGARHASSPTTRADDGRRSDRPGHRGFVRSQWGCAACRPSGPPRLRPQVSMNVIDVDAAPLHEVVEWVQREAAIHGVSVSGGELVGLVPERVVVAAASAGAELPGVDASQVLETVLRSRLAEWPTRSS